MKEKKPRNIAAFPSPDQGSYFGSEGMTLRDYFAAKTLPDAYLGVSHEEESAKRAYAMADAMLKQRELDIE